MAKRKHGDRRYWTLVADPTEYRIDEAVAALDEDWWACAKSDIQIGDGIAVWKAKGGNAAQRGVIALGAVVDGPEYRADKTNPYHLNHQRAAAKIRRVAVRYKQIAKPLWDNGSERDFIRSLNAAKSYGGTVFRTTFEQWITLEYLALDDELDIDNQPPLSFSLEERRAYRLHRRIERNPSASAAVKAHYGYRCEVCDFVFEDKYGNLGQNFIEAHHKRPLSLLIENQTAEYTAIDFAPLCSNCHRMIHRTSDLFDLEKFKKMIKE